MPTRNLYGRDYEIINFKRKITNASETIRSIALARGYLAIADNYRIYNTISGEPLIRGRFIKDILAIKFAQWIEKLLWDYFDIWKAYPQANLPSWCKYSVKDGAVLYEMIEYLNKLEIIRENDIQEAYKQAKEKEKRWKV